MPVWQKLLGVTQYTKETKEDGRMPATTALSGEKELSANDAQRLRNQRHHSHDQGRVAEYKGAVYTRGQIREHNLQPLP